MSGIKVGDAYWEISGQIDGLKKSLDAGLHEVKKMGQQVLAHTKQIGIGLTAIGAGITAAIGGAVKEFTTYGDEVAKAAKRTGLSVEALQELRHAAEQSGASMEELESAFKRQARFIYEASQGGATYTDTLTAMGLTFQDLQGLNPEQQFMVLTEALAGVDDATTQAALAQELFGRSGTSLLPMIQEGASGMAALRQEAQDLGIVLSGESAASAEAFGDLIDELQKTVKGFALAVGEAVVPVLQEWGERLKSLLVSAREWIGNNKELFQTIVKVVAVVGGLAAVFGPLLIILPTVISAVSAVGAVIGSIGLPVLAVAAAIAGVLVLAFFALRDVFMQAIEWVQAHWEQISRIFWLGIDNLMQIFKILGNIFRAGFTIVAAILGGASKSIGEQFSKITGTVDFSTMSILDIIEFYYEGMNEGLGIVNQAIGEAADWLAEHWDEMVAAAKWGVDNIIKPLAQLVSYVIKAANAIGDAMAYIAESLGMGGVPNPQLPGPPRGRAHGGDYQANMPYLVGEHGPELIVPRGAGHVMNAGETARLGGGLNIKGPLIGQAIVRENADIQRIAQELWNVIQRKSGGRGGPLLSAG